MTGLLLTNISTPQNVLNKIVLPFQIASLHSFFPFLTYKNRPYFSLLFAWGKARCKYSIRSNSLPKSLLVPFFLLFSTNFPLGKLWWANLHFVHTPLMAPFWGLSASIRAKIILQQQDALSLKGTQEWDFLAPILVCKKSTESTMF